MSKPGFHQQWQVSAASSKVSLVQPGRPAQPLGCSLPPALQEQQRCLALGGAAPSVFQWNIWWDFSFHTIMPFNSSAVFSSLFSAKSTSKLWGLFPFVQLPVSSDLVSHPWLGEPSGHKRVGFAQNSCLYPGKNPAKQGSLFTMPSLCHSLPEKCKPGRAGVLQQASLTTHLWWKHDGKRSFIARKSSWQRGNNEFVFYFASCIVHWRPMSI